MSAQAMKRRAYNTVSNERKEESSQNTVSDDDSTEPLLQNHSRQYISEEYDPKRKLDFWNDIRNRFSHWVYVIKHVFYQSARTIERVFTSFASFLGKCFSFSSSGNQSSENDNKVEIYLSPIQQERLKQLRQRSEVPFDNSSINHQNALEQLWRLAYPTRQIPPLKSDLWKDMGWQGSDPSTDFRGGGFISLENLIYFAKNYPDCFHRLLHKQDGERAEWEYPFAVAGINVSYMLLQMLELQSVTGKVNTRFGAHFVELLEGDEVAFDELYCVAFQMLDSQWLAKRATYMQFNDVLKSTRVQIENELESEGVSCIQDMPSYKMLNR